MIVMAPVAREELPEYGKYIIISVKCKDEDYGYEHGYCIALHCTTL